MTEELKQAATRAVVAIDALLHNIRRDAPQLSGKAMGYAENAAAELRRALTQRPAAQAGERDDGKHLNGLSHDALVSEIIKCAGRRDALHATHIGKGMSDADYTEFARLRDQDIPALRREILARIATQPAQQATPEQVGERRKKQTKLRKVLQAHGLTKHGDGVVEGDIMAIFDAEPVGEPTDPQIDAVFDGIAHEGGKAVGGIKVAECVRRTVRHFLGNLPTRPAPGVPEGVQRNAARWEEVLRQVGADRQCGGFRFTLYNLRPVHGSNPMQGAVCQHFTQAVDAMLAAAQAKN